MVRLRPCTIQGNVDMFLDAFHNILNVTCHRPPTRRDKGGVLDEMQLLDWIQKPAFNHTRFLIGLNPASD